MLLLDEPLGALDLKLRKQLQVELKRIQMDVGITFVYVTHDQEEALTMSDRIAVMHRGRIEQVGTPEDLYDRPATSFVADFIGTTNLLAGTVEALGPDVATVCLDSGDRLRDRLRRPAARPDRARQHPTRGDRDRAVPNGSRASARGCGPRSSRWRILAPRFNITFARKGGLALSVLAGRSSQRFESGDSVVLSWAPSDALVLGDRPAEMEETS